MHWFQMKEKSAGKKRLILTYYIYKIFGKTGIYLIAFLVSFFTFIFAKDVRCYSKKYFNIISKYINIKPNLFNQYKQILSYAISLADKIIMYMGKYNPEDIFFEDENDKNQLFQDIKQGNGICFLFSHVGNIEVLQAFFQNQKQFPNLGVNVFLSRNKTKIFNNFIETIKKPIPVKYIIAEDFDLTGVIKLKENLEKGEVLFIAGDRLSEYNSAKILNKTMFSHKINLPLGTFKLAKLLDIPVYFISALKRKNGYEVYAKNLKTDDLENDYIKKSEEIILKNPFQFYHFYDFFID